jgi:hypothetical protein
MTLSRREIFAPQGWPLVALAVATVVASAIVLRSRRGDDVSWRRRWTWDSNGEGIASPTRPSQLRISWGPASVRVRPAQTAEQLYQSARRSLLPLASMANVVELAT